MKSSKKYNSIKQLIEILKEQKEEIDYRIEALKTEPTCFEEELIIKYIEKRSTPKVAEYAKKRGKRTQRGTVYQAPDISKLIKEDNDKINPVLLRIAREIFNKNFKAVSRQYG